MTTRRADSQLLTLALQHLEAVCRARLKTVRREAFIGNSRWDGIVTLRSRHGLLKYIFEVKSNLRPETVRHLAVRVRSNLKYFRRRAHFLLIADHVNPLLARRLKDTRINFVDTAGNAFIDLGPSLYVYVEGCKPSLPTKEHKSRLFQPSGLSLIYGLLVNPDSVNHAYRRLAVDNGVALGTVAWVMRDLKQQGYLAPVGKNQLRLTKRSDLLEAWVRGYSTRLRPKLLLGEFESPSKEPEVVLSMIAKYASQQKTDWALTGGYAADELVHHYRGRELVCFIADWRPDVALKQLKWMPAPGGTLMVLSPFSPKVFENFVGIETTNPVANPLLIYAELLHQGSERALETAQLIYRQFLEENHGKN